MSVKSVPKTSLIPDEIKEELQNEILNDEISNAKIKKKTKKNNIENVEENIKVEKIIEKNIHTIDIDKNQENILHNDGFNIVKKSSRTPIIIVSIIIIISILLIAFCSITIVSMKSNNIVNGVHIKGIDVSNLTKENAKKKLEEYITQNLPEFIHLKHNEYETSIQLSSLEVNFNLDNAIDLAFNIGKNQNFFHSGYDTIISTLFNKNIDPSITLNEQVLLDALNDISTKLPDTVVESSYYIEGTDLILTSGKEGNIVNVNQMFSYIKNGILNLTLKDRTLTLSTIAKKPSQVNLDEIYSKVYSEPINASYTQNPYTFTPSKNGIDFAISLDEAKNMLLEETTEYIIPLKVLYPSITTGAIGMEAFPDILSSFSTKYSIRDADRTTNLRLASNKINAVVLMPGETFSYNKIVGARTIAAGYREAPMYVSGKVVDGLGGGICQITSTLYNAVLFANLDIVERSNHQFIPSYVTASRDATVVYGSIDFKFKNNRNYPIKILSSVSNGIANFEIRGLKTDNDYEVQISAYKTGTTATSIYSEAYKILKQNGQVISKHLLSKDVYKKY